MFPLRPIKFSSIIPIPKVPVSPNKSRREKSEIISSPEYRAQLVEAQGRSMGKRKSNTPNKIIGECSKTVFKNMIREEWFCPICEGPDDRIDDGEAWVKCRICTAFIHKGCSNKNVCFLCKEQ